MKMTWEVLGFLSSHGNTSTVWNIVCSFKITRILLNFDGFQSGVGLYVSFNKNCTGFKDFWHQRSAVICWDLVMCTNCTSIRTQFKKQGILVFYKMLGTCWVAPASCLQYCWSPHNFISVTWQPTWFGVLLRNLLKNDLLANLSWGQPWLWHLNSEAIAWIRKI